MILYTTHFYVIALFLKQKRFLHIAPLHQTMKRSLRKSLCDGGGLRWDELPPYVAMGYKMSTQKSLGYSPYFLLFGRDPIFQARQYSMVEKEPSDEEMRVFLSTRGQTFRRVMPLAMRNLAIA